jgi:hypothetical protein
MKLTMQIIKKLILEQMDGQKKVYKPEECSIHVVNEGEIVYALIVDPDKFAVGLVAAKKPKKDCNLSVQVKNIGTATEYRGQGFGTFLYYAAEIIGKEYQGLTGGITSDHEESSSKDAKGAWASMIGKKKIQLVYPKQGQAKFDYTGKETPDVKTDDCDMPSSGDPAVDYAFKFTSGLRSKYAKIFKQMVKNMKRNPIPEDEVADMIMDLWGKVYKG